MKRDSKNRSVKILSCGIFLTLFSFSAYAKTFHVQIVTQPPVTDGHFEGRIVAADFNDPTPNFCYGRNDGCYYAGFVNDKSWGENGKAGYSTTDNAHAQERMVLAREAKTMGELARTLNDKGLLSINLRDFLPKNQGDSPTFCVFANISRQIAGTLASNCADAPVAPTACTLTPDSIEFDWGMISNTSAGKIELSKSVNITCTRPANIGIYISGDYISLNGNKNTRAEFDLGKGWTGKTVVDVKDQMNVLIKSRLVGLEHQSGDFTGSSVIIMEQL
ncbi:hypothetical protein [Enterobacter cloacae]|uniref:MrpH family fimbial adhesin n=1 Tax=Enterobacter cloacae TaxID=550 RepID=UPI003174F6A1